MPKQDVNAYFFDDPLFPPSGIPTNSWSGRAIARYEVNKVQDVRNLGSRQAYHVECTIRLRIFKTSGFSLPKTDLHEWAGYPAALINIVEPVIAGCTGQLELVSYSPKTINTSVNSDHGLMNGADTGLTRQHTSGSSTSVTNSFGVNIGVDDEGDPSGGANFDHSQTFEERNEWMDAANKGRSNQLSDNASMTIKDWGAFASLNPAPGDASLPVMVTWVFAQEYPWDVLGLRPTVAATPIPDVPPDVAARLFGTSAVAPPSHLSQMGLDFVCRVSWLVTPKAWISGGEPSLSINLDGELWQGTHSIAKPSKSSKNHALDGPVTPPNSTGKITIASVEFAPQPTGGGPGKKKHKVARGRSTADDTVPAVSHTIPLEQLSLLPITDTGTSNGAVLAFGQNEFHYFQAGAFAITTKENKLYATGGNFGKQAVNEIVVPVPAGNLSIQSPILTLKFKVLDLESEFELLLKHWVKSGTDPVTVSVYVNPPVVEGAADLSGPPQALRYVAELEGEGGDNNVTSIALRDLSFGTNDYHDYLRLGLNTVYVTLTADAPQQYVLRAVAIA